MFAKTRPKLAAYTHLARRAAPKIILDLEPPRKLTGDQYLSTVDWAVEYSNSWRIVHGTIGVNE